jgi:nucleoside-diphosphate-sugar epimerase
MIVAVTGGTGAVGRKLVAVHLAAGDSVRVLTRREASGLARPVQVHRGDLVSDHDVLARFADGADVLYQCAAEIHDAARMTEVNAKGTENLAIAAQHRIGRWVQLSSIAVYGAPERGIIDEETPLQATDVYGRSKAEGDRLVIEAAARGSFTSALVRPVKVIGAGIESGNNQVLYRLFALVDRGLFFFVGEAGALTHYVHVDNLVEALVRAGRAPFTGSRAYNLSDDRTLEDFVRVIADALGKPVPKLRLPEIPVRVMARVLGVLPAFPLDSRRLAALVNRAAFPCERIRRELGLEYAVSMEDALRELVVKWRRER